MDLRLHFFGLEILVCHKVDSIHYFSLLFSLPSHGLHQHMELLCWFKTQAKFIVGLENCSFTKQPKLKVH